MDMLKRGISLNLDRDRMDVYVTSTLGCTRHCEECSSYKLTKACSTKEQRELISS